MRFLIFAFSVVVLSSGCSYDPCASGETRAAWIASGGPVGLVAALALSCPQPEPAPEPIAAVAGSGLVVQPEVPPPDMGEAQQAPDLAEAPPPPDADHDGIPDVKDRCPTTPSGQTPDPARLGCPAPRTYTVRLPAAAFAAAGPITVADGVVTSRASYDWAGSKFENGSLSAVVFFENAGASASNAVTFELTGTADFSAPVSTADSCKPWKGEREDASDPSPKSGNPNDVVCVPRRLDLCPVDLVSKAAQLLGEAQCADGVQRGAGYRSKASAPVKIVASVPSADWTSAEPKPAAGIEVQVLFSGNLKLSGWEVLVTVKETLL